MKNMAAVWALCLLVFATTAMAATQYWKNGTVLRVEGSPDIYYYHNGYAEHVPSMKVFNCMGLSKYRSVTISHMELKSLPKSALLIRGSDQKVYRIDGEHKRHVPNLQVFRKKGFNEQEVIPVADGVIMCIPQGPPIR